MEKEIKVPKFLSKGRIALSEACVRQLEYWQAQITERFKGMTIKNSELVDWLVTSHASELSACELKDIQSKYWDDIALASWALKELKRAKASGENVSLPQLLGQKLTAPQRSPGACRRKDSNENSETNNKTLEKEERDSKSGV